MKGAEFIRRVQRYAKAQGLPCRVDEKRGKGSHVTLYLGGRLTVVRSPADELKPGPCMRCSGNWVFPVKNCET